MANHAKREHQGVMNAPALFVTGMRTWHAAGRLEAGFVAGPAQIEFFAVRLNREQAQGRVLSRMESGLVHCRVVACTHGLDIDADA